MRFISKRAFPFLLTLVVIVTIIVLLIATRPEPASETRETPPARVETAIVTATDLKPTRRFSGRIEPRYRSLLRFEVSGRVTQIHADAGQQVANGDPLISIDFVEYQDRLDEAAAQLQQEKMSVERDKKLHLLAQVNTELAQKEVDRLSKLGTELASQSTLDVALKALSQQKSEALRLQYAIDTAAQRQLSRQLAVDKAQRELDRTNVRAPFDGIVSKRFVSPGDYASVNSNAVEIIDAGMPELLIHVPTSVVPALSISQSLELKRDQQVFTGKVSAIQPAADEQTGTHEVRITVDSNALVGGMVMQVDLPLNVIQQALTVPVSAILSDDGDDYLFIVQQENLERRAVQLGMRVGNLQIIIDGAREGEVIVARDVAALVDQQHVVVAAAP